MSDDVDDGSVFPETPKFTKEELERCRRTGDYKSLMFEWYKFVGGLCVVVSNIMPISPAFLKVPLQQHNVLVGLLNRCAKLMLSNVALSSERKFGETTSIIDRCIFESAVKIMWLCHKSSHDEFLRFMADGLRTELELKAEIDQNVTNNGGNATKLEARMLASIDKHFVTAGMTYEDVRKTPKLRDIASILGGLGKERIAYVAMQRIGSHHVHGTWPSLLIHYLELNEKGTEYPLGPRVRTHDTHINQFMATPLIVIDAMKYFTRYLISGEDADQLCELLSSTWEEIWRIYLEAGEDAT